MRALQLRQRLLVRRDRLAELGPELLGVRLQLTTARGDQGHHVGGQSIFAARTMTCLSTAASSSAAAARSFCSASSCASRRAGQRAANTAVFTPKSVLLRRGQRSRLEGSRPHHVPGLEGSFHLHPLPDRLGLLETQTRG